MKTEIFEMGPDGRLVKSDTEKFANLQPGTVLEWGGNAGWGPTRFCILSRNAGNYGVSYQGYNIDETGKNATLHHIDAHSIKDPNDSSLWHSQHMFIQPETIDPETVEAYRQDHIRQAQALKASQDAATAEADRLEEIGRKLWPSLIGDCPAVIIAELEKDTSDVQTDYFASQTIGTVILAPSKHKRDLFPEMRKAADLLPETAHLGIGKGQFSPRVEIAQDFVSNGSCYHKGTRSHWHRELDQNENGNSLVFTTRQEAQDYITGKGEPYPINFDGQTINFVWNIREDEIEHREKYSMGKGFYLGVNSHSGWNVSKEVFYKGEPQRGHFIALAKHHDHLTTKKTATKAEPKPKELVTATPTTDTPATGYEVKYERDWTWITFTNKPAESVRESMSQNGGKFSGKRTAWYFTRHIEPAEIGLQA